MPPPSAAPGARILVVDDELSIRQLLSESFGDDGYEVRTASNGSDALHLIAGWRPDLIVLDLMMPTMNGDTARAIDLASTSTHWRSLPLP